jgi:hypothetical protein
MERKVKRQPNFTADELEVLISGVEKRNKVFVLFCPKSLMRPYTYRPSINTTVFNGGPHRYFAVAIFDSTDSVT